MERRIKFTESQKGWIKETQARHQRELDRILDIIAKEHGILEEVKKEPEKWAFKEDWSGIFKVEE